MKHEKYIILATAKLLFASKTIVFIWLYARILELRTKVLNFNLKQIEQCYYGQIKELRVLDHKLCTLYKSITKYYFVSEIKGSSALLVGEGNLSFTINLEKNYSYYLTLSLLHMKIIQSCLSMQDLMLNYWNKME